MYIVISVLISDPHRPPSLTLSLPAVLDVFVAVSRCGAYFIIRPHNVQTEGGRTGDSRLYHSRCPRIKRFFLAQHSFHPPAMSPWAVGENWLTALKNDGSLRLEKRRHGELLQAVIYSTLMRDTLDYYLQLNALALQLKFDRSPRPN